MTHTLIITTLLIRRRRETGGAVRILRRLVEGVGFVQGRSWLDFRLLFSYITSLPHSSIFLFSTTKVYKSPFILLLPSTELMFKQENTITGGGN